jgi:hypothetical protein
MLKSRASGSTGRPSVIQTLSPDDSTDFVAVESRVKARIEAKKLARPEGLEHTLPTFMIEGLEQLVTALLAA